MMGNKEKILKNASFNNNLKFLDHRRVYLKLALTDESGQNKASDTSKQHSIVSVLYITLPNAFC